MSTRDSEKPEADELALRASLSDPEAFGAFYDRHAKEILRFFYARVASPQTAADLTAETFASAFASRSSYGRQGATPRAWLFGIAKHELSHFLRGHKVETEARRKLGIPRLELDDLSLERIEELVDLSGLLIVLPEALAELTPRLRRALELRVVNGLDYSEIASRLNCSEGAARVRVSRALLRLHGHFERRRWE
ncbi:MAG: RNA polymerase sigma factor [Actinomycetota bacterium]